MKTILKFSIVFVAVLLLAFSPIVSPITQTPETASAFFVLTPEKAKEVKEKCDGDTGCITDEVGRTISDAVGPCDWDIACHLASMSKGLFFSIGKGALLLSLPLFNASVQASVVEMDKHIAETGVSAGWDIFLGIANIALIFILLFIGIATILKVQSYGYKTLLAKLIILALLVNFSFFVANAVISISNDFAIDIVNALSNDQSITDRFAKAVNIQSVDEVNNIQDAGNLFLVGLFGLIFMLVTAFIFLAGAILLLLRLVVLAFVIMLGPLAFVAMILPVTSSYATRWWRTLFSQSFFAPIYLLLVLVSLKVLEATPRVQGGASDFFASAGTRGVDIFLKFVIATGLMIGALIIAKELGATGANSVIKAGQNWRRGTQGVLQGVLGRNLFGVPARMAARSNWMRRLASQQPAVGRALYGAFDTVASAGFGTNKGAEQAAQSRLANIEKTAQRIKSVKEEDLRRLPGESVEAYEERVIKSKDKDKPSLKEQGTARREDYVEGLGEGVGGVYSAAEARGKLTEDIMTSKIQEAKDKARKGEVESDLRNNKADLVKIFREALLRPDGTPATSPDNLGDPVLVRLLKNIAEGQTGATEVLEKYLAEQTDSPDSMRQLREEIARVERRRTAEAETTINDPNASKDKKIAAYEEKFNYEHRTNSVNQLSSSIDRLRSELRREERQSVIGKKIDTGFAAGASKEQKGEARSAVQESSEENSE